MKFSIRVEGGEALARNLRELSAGVSRRVIREALLTAGEPMRRTASQKVRRAPGAPDIADHIGISPARARASGDVAIAIGPTIEKRTDQPRRFETQGRHLEIGTVHMPAFPFMRPAFDAEVQATITRMAGLLWQALARRGVTTTRTGGGGGGLQ